MRQLIAEIKLAPGQVGFYDEFTNIHLTLTHPLGKVYKGMNTSNLQRAVKSRRLELLSGSLVPTPIASKEGEVKATYKVKTEEPVQNVKLVVEAKQEAVEEVKVEVAPVVEEEVVAVEEVTEAPVEEVPTEEAVEEAAPKKKSTSKAKK